MYEFYGKMGIMTDRERRKRMHAAGELKSFSVQQFFKNAAEVWVSSPHLRSKSNYTKNRNKNLGENRKNRNCLSKSKGCNERYGFRGNCDSQGKLGMCPSLAEPDSVISLRIGSFQLRAAGKQKFFDPAIFQKCWRGSGRVALIAARRQRNPCAMLLAHGEGGEKSESFSRRGEQDRPAL